ncbi:hypothetical protein ACFQL8_39225, partial [Streptomyces goshikiensis]
MSDLHGVRLGGCWFAGEDEGDGVLGGVFQGDVLGTGHLDAISFGVILRQSGVVTTGLVQRMVP